MAKFEEIMTKVQQNLAALSDAELEERINALDSQNIILFENIPTCKVKCINGSFVNSTGQTSRLLTKEEADVQ